LVGAGLGFAVVGDAVLVASGAGLAGDSWVVCDVVLSWARAGSVRMDLSRLVSCDATHTMGAAIRKTKISAFVAGLSHRTTPYLPLRVQPHILSAETSEGYSRWSADRRRQGFVLHAESRVWTLGAAVLSDTFEAVEVM
jgi:hypothetical protein